MLLLFSLVRRVLLLTQDSEGHSVLPDLILGLLLGFELSMSESEGGWAFLYYVSLMNLQPEALLFTILSRYVTSPGCSGSRALIFWRRCRITDSAIASFWTGFRAVRRLRSVLGLICLCCGFTLLRTHLPVMTL